jgi:hypothetical protein
VKHLLTPLLAIAFAFTTVPAARADLISFDDLPGSNGAITNGYMGYNWSNFRYVNTVTDPISANSGYANAAVSGQVVAQGTGGSPNTISSAAPFILNSGYFTAAFVDGMTINVVGTLNGATVLNTSFTVNTTGPTLESFGGVMVDTVTFTAWGGTPHPGYPAYGEQFALDNLNTTGSVQSAAQTPEPASLTLFGLAAVCTGAYAWRRRRPHRQG